MSRVYPGMNGELAALGANVVEAHPRYAYEILILEKKKRRRKKKKKKVKMMKMMMMMSAHCFESEGKQH